MFDVQVVGQVEGVYVVDQVEVDDFGIVVLFGFDLFGCDVEDFGGGGFVDVFVVGEGF